jgi:hypothetical protein
LLQNAVIQPSRKVLNAWLKKHLLLAFPFRIFRSSFQKPGIMKKLSLFIVMITFIGHYAAIGQQWANNGNHIYNTNTQNVGIGTGTSFTPTDKLHINNGSSTAGIMAESSYTGASMKALGYFRIKNTATGDMFNMVLRKNGDNHEMLQSCYDATSSLWREYAYFNYTTRKYEMRVGVNDAEFLNAGNILFNNTGTVGIGTTTPSSSNKFTVFQGNGKAIYGNTTGTANCVAIYGWESATTGVSYAVMGLHESNEGAAGHFLANNNSGECAGVYGRADGNVYPGSCGVVGHHYYSGIGVGAWSYSGDLIRAYSGDFPGGTLRFYVNNNGAVYADGGYNSFKKTMSAGANNEYRTFNSIQATEYWIEDVGSADLRKGAATVNIDPVYAQSVDLQNGYKVFLTPVSEEMVILTVAGKSPDKFIVKGTTLDGRPASCSFDYRIMAKDNEKRNSRMEIVNIPEPVIVPRKD